MYSQDLSFEEYAKTLFLNVSKSSLQPLSSSSVKNLNVRVSDIILTGIRLQELHFIKFQDNDGVFWRKI